VNACTGHHLIKPVSQQRKALQAPAQTGSPSLQVSVVSVLSAMMSRSVPGHPQENPERLHIAAGTLLLTDNDEAFTLQAGCSAVAISDAPHSYTCANDIPLALPMTAHDKAR